MKLKTHRFLKVWNIERVKMWKCNRITALAFLRFLFPYTESAHNTFKCLFFYTELLAALFFVLRRLVGAIEEGRTREWMIKCSCQRGEESKESEETERESGTLSIDDSEGMALTTQQGHNPQSAWMIRHWNNFKMQGNKVWSAPYRKKTRNIWEINKRLNSAAR